MTNTRKRHLEIYDASVKVLKKAGGVERIDTLLQEKRIPLFIGIDSAKENEDFTSISIKVNRAHHVLNIGAYNVCVSSCGKCNSTKRIENFGSHCLGFGIPDKPSGSLDKNIAIVYECPDCFERQWSHCTLRGYRTYLRYLRISR